MSLLLVLSACNGLPPEASARSRNEVVMQIDRGTVYVTAALPGQTEQLVAVVGRDGNTQCDSNEVWVTVDLRELDCGPRKCPDFGMHKGLFHTPPSDPGYTRLGLEWHSGFVDEDGDPMAGIPAFCAAWEAELQQRWSAIPLAKVECWTMNTCPTWVPSQENSQPPTE